LTESLSYFFLLIVLVTAGVHGMISITRILLLTSSLALPPGLSSASTLFSQDIDFTGNFGTANSSFLSQTWAENFTLVGDSTVTGFSLGTWYDPNQANDPLTIDWSLHESTGGSVGSSIASGNVSPTATDNGPVPGGGFQYVTLSAGLPDVMLTSGEFWLAVRVNVPPGQPYYWGNSAPGDNIYAVDVGAGFFLAGGVGTASNWAFSIQGTTGPTDPVDPTDPSVIPLPASAFLLLGALGGMRAIRRRKVEV
jgi:hypothetical protein